jgi:hypothetical protein
MSGFSLIRVEFFTETEKFCRSEVTEGERERVNGEAVRFLVFC